MSNQTAEAAVMAKAVAAATVEVALDLNSTMLIGIVGKTDAPEALLRNRDGSITRVARGDKTNAGTVIGIDETSVRLQKSGKVTVLQLPRG